MDKIQSDEILRYKLETEFFPDHVRHTRYLGEAKKRNEKVKEDWSTCGELGRGGLGVVHKQIEKNTGRYRAIKTMERRRLSPRVDYSRELLVMAKLAKYPSLFVEFLGWYEELETLYIATEYLQEGNLTQYIGTPLPQETVRNISKQILEGLKVMHQHGIAHRDLKPANIFVVSTSPVCVKLGDFGVSKRILAQATTTLHTQLSTQLYSAPEFLELDSNSETSDYTNSVDIWSVGCVIYELLLGKRLFDSEFQLYRYSYGICPFPEGRLRNLSPPTDDIGISFLKPMLAIQPEDRPTAGEALSHVWLAGLKSGSESRAQFDTVEWYKLDTEFFQDYVRHTRYVGKGKNRNKEVEDVWSNCGELGEGGFGVVHKQIQKTTGRYRAVKRIGKKPPLRLDYSRELLVMAKLAKYPSLFVEFLGWYEEPETLYIAMEYLPEGDLSTLAPLPQGTVKSILKQLLEGLKVMHQEGIAHRDIKPANIFVASKSPMHVKLADFGASKWVQDSAITTLNTQVSTPLYGAPEVRGLDSNSETSIYTNSVDLWSLGCVIYELLVGERLFVSEHQYFSYFFNKCPFPEEKLKGLSPPIDDAGISLLKSMLSIQPEDRPTAAEALNDVWLAGLTSGKERSGGDEGLVPPSRDESTPNRKRKNGLAPGDKSMKGRSEKYSPTRDDTKCILREVGGMLTGILMLPGIPTKIFKLAGILTVIVMLASIGARVLTKPSPEPKGYL